MPIAIITAIEESSSIVALFGSVIEEIAVAKAIAIIIDSVEASDFTITPVIIKTITHLIEHFIS